MNESETLFAEHLSLLNLSYEYEPTEVDGVAVSRHPDFRVVTPSGDVYFEVTDIAPPSLPHTFGFLDPYTPIRNKLRDKHKQGRHLKGKYPYIVVLRFTGLNGDETDVMGAMFGDFGVQMQIDTSTGSAASDPKWAFLQGGRLQEKRLTTISAVAVLHRFNATKAEVQRRIRKQIGPRENHIVSKERAMEIIMDEYESPDFCEDA